MKKTAKRKVATKLPRTFVNVVLDESGSMIDCAKEAVTGYNDYLDSLKKSEGRFLVTLTKFNTATQVMDAGTALRYATRLEVGKNYRPGGFTALYDAVAKCVLAMDAKVLKTDRVLTVIITDGQENSSKEWTRDRVAALREEREGRGNWSFIYLSAAPTAFVDAQNIGIGRGNTMAYKGDPAGTRAMSATLCAATGTYTGQHVNSTKSFFQDAPADPDPLPKARRRTLK